MMTADNARPPRPCTEYNIFFQLERAHILQVQLGSGPRLDGSEAFRPSQPSYAGLPPLPERYASLVLPYDWHLPGKEKRRKRKHCRTHGAIGFHDLSNRIASAWKAVDDEIKAYCARVCEVGTARYKLALREWKKNGGGKKKKATKDCEPPAQLERSEKAKNQRASLEDTARQDDIHAPLGRDLQPGDDEIRGAWRAQDERPLIEQLLSLGTGILLPHRENSPDGSTASGEPVDMDDDEIMGMWKNGTTATSPDSAARRVSDANEYGQEIESVPLPFAVDERIGQRESAFSLDGYDETMEEMRRMKSMVEKQVRELEGACLPPIRRRWLMACSA